VRIAQGEVRRRGPRLRIAGPELDDLAVQAAADALVAITGKLGQFRGESRFTTWAYKFVMFEVSAKVGRHFWRHPDVRLDAEDWDRLPGHFGFDPAREAEWRDLLGALHRAVDEVLTARQRRIFVAIVLNGVPLDALVIELASNRNAIYKTLFDARRKLQAALAANGYRRRLFEELMNGWSALDDFLRTDPRDLGCAQAMQMLQIYAELTAAGAPAEQRYPGIAAHLRACGQCGEDFEGLLAALRDQAH
jgi:RNA polymerase sigma-70 factor (ECF subfamily)